MDNIKDELQDVPEEEVIVEIKDDKDNSFYFREEQQLVIGKKTFAILVGIDGCDCEDENCSCHDHEHEEDEEENVIIAKVEFDENGDPVYVDPTDEEFESVKAAYEKEFEEE